MRVPFKLCSKTAFSYNVFEYTDRSLKGRCSASPGVVEAVFTLYIPAFLEVHFSDKERKVIAACFDDAMQHYWLPESTYQQLCERLDETLFSAVVTKDNSDRFNGKVSRNMMFKLGFLRGTG